MATAPTAGLRWLAFATKIGVELDSAAALAGSSQRLDVVSAQWIGPDGGMPATVELRIKTRTGLVLGLDMPLELDGIVDATGDYDERDGVLGEHDYGFEEPGEIERYFGRDGRG